MGSPPHPQVRLPASSNSSSLQDEGSQFSLNIDLPQSSAREGSKEATIRDFFSSNRTSARTRKVDARSSEGVIATQDLLHPLEHLSKPMFRNSVLPTGLADCLWVNNENNHVGAEVIQFGRQDGTLELPNPGLNRVFGGEKGEKLLKMEWKTESKPLTPRSKHSATEQRRRCKINDRFQMLRQLVPYNDQKRDKASFLLEVVEYVQILQEKVRKYEATLHGREKESLRSLSWDPSQKNTGLHSTVADGLGIDSVRENSSFPMFSNRPDLKQAVDRSEQKMGGNESSESDCGRTAVRTSEAAHHSSPPVEALPILLCSQVSSEKDHSLRQQLVRSLDFGYQDANSKACNTAMAKTQQFHVASPSHTVSSDGAHLDSNPSKCEQNMACAAQMKEPMLVHGGVISVSCLYSRRLLDALDSALQSSGLDLSQASISVQINLGKSAMTNSSLNVGLSTEGQCAPHELEGPSKRLKMGL